MLWILWVLGLGWVGLLLLILVGFVGLYFGFAFVVCDFLCFGFDT